MSRSRTLLALSALAALLLSATGCGGSAHAPEEKYYLVATNIKLPYWQSAFAGLSRAAAQLGVKAELVGPDTYDPKAQLAEFQNVVRRKPAGILVSPGEPKLFQPEIDAAIAQGIPVVTLDSDAPASKRLLFIGTDNYKAGLMGGQLAARLLKAKGNVAVFSMPEQVNLQERLNGYEEAFAALPQLKITKTVDIKGDARLAFDATKEIVDTKTAIDAFVCLEAIACAEVAEVVERERLAGKVVIVAMDTEPRTIEWIQKGVISATIGQKPFTMAFFGLKLMDDLHHHPPTPLAGNWAANSFSPLPSSIHTGATLIDKTNVEAFLSERQTAGNSK
jgi:ribose transport system substrate-binding protein